VKKIVVTLLFFLTFTTLLADVPIRREEFIYSILAFNGRDYNGTFAKQNADIIYLMADADNFITARKTLVYYWPIAQEWKTDTDNLDIAFEGNLELGGKNMVPRKIEQSIYTYYNIRGEYEVNWEVAVEKKAEEVWESYQDTIKVYFDAMTKYQNERRAYEMIMNELAKQIGELRISGQDVSTLVEKLQNIEAPKRPEAPTTYNVPPIKPQKAFIINLPAGEYRIRFLTEEDKIMESSERTLKVFNKSRKESIGYEVIPGDKWTREVESKTPSSVIYVNGSTDLYMRPFFQQEYNDLYYKKMQRNESRGNPNIRKWVRIQQVPEASLIITVKGTGPKTVYEKSYYVEHTKAASLGYRIVPFDPDGDHKERNPSLIAFHVPITSSTKGIQLKVQDKNGQLLHDSRRQIRVISEKGPNYILILFALLPLLMWSIVSSWRSRKYTS
jgi:hypothetical protein